MSAGAGFVSAAATDAFTINGGGQDSFQGSDALYYLYQPLTGDATITARITGVQDYWDNRGGLMIRESLDPTARDVSLVSRPSDSKMNGTSGLNEGAEFRAKTAAGGRPSTITQQDFRMPNWLRLSRTGNQFDAYISTDGSSWTLLGFDDARHERDGVHRDGGGLGAARRLDDDEFRSRVDRGRRHACAATARPAARRLVARRHRQRRRRRKRDLPDQLGHVLGRRRRQRRLGHRGRAALCIHLHDRRRRDCRARRDHHRQPGVGQSRRHDSRDGRSLLAAGFHARVGFQGTRVPEARRGRRREHEHGRRGVHGAALAESGARRQHDHGVAIGGRIHLDGRRHRYDCDARAGPRRPRGIEPHDHVDGDRDVRSRDDHRRARRRPTRRRLPCRSPRRRRAPPSPRRRA